MGNALYVDTMIGTVGDGQIEKSHGGGKTYPGACVPGGMVQLSPDTVSGGDNGITVICIYELIAVIAHTQLLHIAQLPQAVAALHPLNHCVTEMRRHCVDHIHTGLVHRQKIR